MLAHFHRFALYNQWANKKLFEVVDRLPEEDYYRDLDAFFDSIHGTLNHILVGDRAWLARIEKAGPVPSSLDERLCDDFRSLWDARYLEDQRIIAMTERLNQRDIDGILEYNSMAGDTYNVPLAGVLTHIFNHQTHHRGQVHHMLSSLDMDPPALDMIYYLLEMES